MRMATGMQLVVFRIGTEYFAVGIDAIREIVKLIEVVEVPDAPGFLEGMINLRGRIVPVIDMRKRLRLGESEKTKSTRILIAESHGSTVGLIVDSVHEVLRIQHEDVEPPPEMISAVGVEYINGVAKNDGRLIILLDLGKIMDPNDMKKITDSLDATHDQEPVGK